jgi:hypothetical protein
MNVHVLIDAIVRQTMVLVAQLATAGGERAALGHTANQVFLELTNELKRQGLSHTLIADLFGLSLRTYHNKVRRLSESATDRGRPLWNAVLDFVQNRGTVSRGEILMRFHRDDGTTVKSVLTDLVEEGLVFAKGRGEQIAYRAANSEELRLDTGANANQSRENFVWILVARHSPMTRGRLLELSQFEESDLDLAIERLARDGKVVRHDGVEPSYTSVQCVLPVGQAAGWEASVFDHYQAVVTAICAKLALGSTRAEQGERIGGSTYSVEVWPGHPLFEEACGTLQSFRDQARTLRERIDQLNLTLQRPRDGVQRIVTYVGQTVQDGLDVAESQS